MLLQHIGFNDFFDSHFSPYKEKDFKPARVIRQNKTNYIIMSEVGELTAQLSGKMLHEENALKPVIGDWVVISVITIFLYFDERNANCLCPA